MNSISYRGGTNPTSTPSPPPGVFFPLRSSAVHCWEAQPATETTDHQQPTNNQPQTTNSSKGTAAAGMCSATMETTRWFVVRFANASVVLPCVRPKSRTSMPTPTASPGAPEVGDMSDSRWWLLSYLWPCFGESILF